MQFIYLDWNILSAIQAPEAIPDIKTRAMFQNLKAILELMKDDYCIPFSQAHCRDLYKREIKGNVNLVQESLSYVQGMCNGCCFTQYWRSETVSIETQDVEKYYQRFKTQFQNEFNPTSFSDLDLNGNLLDVFKTLPHNIDFSSIPADIDCCLFLRARQENSIYALMEDIFEYSNKLRTDPRSYNEAKSIISKTLGLGFDVNHQSDIIQALDNVLPSTVIGTTFTQFQDYKISGIDNLTFQNIVSKFMKLDLFGYGSDKLTVKNQHANVVTDALHAFYAAHTSIYISNDKKALRKTREVYKSEGITTLCFRPSEFLDWMYKIAFSGNGEQQKSA